MRSFVVRYGVVLVILTVLAAAASIGLTLPATPALAQGGPAGDNDAGSGQDAGNSPHDALPIASAARVWTANLTPPGTDSDWYTIATSQAFCATAKTNPSTAGSFTLATSADLASSVTREAAPHATTRIFLASPIGHAPFLGIEPTSIAMASQGGGSAPNPGRYTFSLDRAAYGDLDPGGDGESPEAGATASTAAELPAGCAAGQLSGATDVEDRYFLDVDAPREITFSFAIASGEAAEARIVKPGGSTRAILQSGDAVSVWAGDEGRWTVVIAHPAPTTLGSRALSGLLPALSTVGDTDYFLGTTDGPGDTEPCRPSCLE